MVEQMKRKKKYIKYIYIIITTAVDSLVVCTGRPGPQQLSRFLA